MKKFLVILVFAVVAMAANAQTKVSGSKTFRILPTNADTLNLATVDHNYLYIPNYCVKAKVQVDLDSIAGDPAIQTIIRKSMDYVTWVNMDTISTTDASTNGISTVMDVYAPYLDIQSTGITNAQTTKLTYTILIEKNPE